MKRGQGRGAGDGRKVVPWRTKSTTAKKAAGTKKPTSSAAAALGKLRRARAATTRKVAGKVTPLPSRKPTMRLPIIQPDEIRTILFELSRTLAPTDLVQLMEGEEALRERVAIMAGDLELLRDQTMLALDIVREHLDGGIPQIPCFTVYTLAASLSYFAEALDIIPDFLPRIGQLDDALVMAMAFEAGRDGIRRYCDFKGIDSTRYMSARRRPI